MKVNSPWKAGNKFTGDPQTHLQKWSAQVFILFKTVSSNRIWRGKNQNTHTKKSQNKTNKKTV